MSFSNTFDSIDSSVTAMSQPPPDSPMPPPPPRHRNAHLSIAQMRGVIPLFSRYFPKTPGKRMHRDEKKRRWQSYKSKIYSDYGRVISGKFASEKALIKRYSDPLSFLKYKLKRPNELRVSDLSQADQDYFHEIGGVDDIDELYKKTYNIDSPAKVANNFGISAQGAKRRRINDNSNSRLRNNSPEVTILSTSAAKPPKLERTPKVNPQLTQALHLMEDKLDIFEREQLEKKKLEMYEVTKQKLAALRDSVEAQLQSDPHLIGCLPSLENQAELAFDCWFHSHKCLILKDRAVKDNIDMFVRRLSILRENEFEWKSFLGRWKMRRIIYDDEFTIVWNEMKEDMNLVDVMSDGEVETMEMANQEEEKQEELRKNAEDSFAL